MTIYKRPGKKLRWIQIIALCLTVLAVPFGATSQVQAQADSRYYEVYISHVSTGMGDQSGSPEFFAKIYNPEHNKWHRTRKVSGRNFSPPRGKMDCSGSLCATHPQIPDWGIWGSVNMREMDRVGIRLTEEDSWGSDDHVDIARGSNKDLWIWITRTPGRNWVYFENAWRECRRMTLQYPTHTANVCDFTSRGTGGESATVRISVRFPPQPLP